MRVISRQVVDFYTESSHFHLHFVHANGTESVLPWGGQSPPSRMILYSSLGERLELRPSYPSPSPPLRPPPPRKPHPPSLYFTVTSDGCVNEYDQKNIILVRPAFIDFGDGGNIVNYHWIQW